MHAAASVTEVSDSGPDVGIPSNGAASSLADYEVLTALLCSVAFACTCSHSSCQICSNRCLSGFGKTGKACLKGPSCPTCSI